MAGVGHLKRICKDAFRVAGAVQETCSSEMFGGQGTEIPDRRSILEHQIFRFAKMVCVTGAALETDGVEKSQNTLVRGRQLCTQLSIFEGSLAECFVFDVVNFELRKSRRIAALLMLSSSKAEEV